MAGGTAPPGDENSPENGSLAPMGLAPSSDWSSLIIAIDYVLALDNEEWSRRLAVLTREALYLLQPEVGEPDPLMLFGRAWWRISMQDIVDIQLVPAEKQLRICTSLIFERDAHLREAPGCADMRRWHGVIGTVWSERSEPVLKTALESCLPGAAENRPSSPSFGLSWSKQSRPWRRDALPEILALGTLLKERDGLLWGGWTERTFVLTANGKLLYYLRTESNDEVLGDLRGVIDLDGAILELRPLDEEEISAMPGCSPSFLLITAAEEPEPQPFYEWPKRCATLACRGETPTQQNLWEQKLLAAIESLRADRQRGGGGGALRHRAPAAHAGSAATPPAGGRGRPPASPSPLARDVGAGIGGGYGASADAGAAAAAGAEAWASALGWPLLLALLNLSWLLIRLAPEGVALWTTLLLTNTSAVYLLRPRPAAPPPTPAPPPRHPRVGAGGRPPRPRPWPGTSARASAAATALRRTPAPRRQRARRRGRARWGGRCCSLCST
eukprot:Transcript_6101.p1 GENE.Transcript_6101~~Transcript_6101.p1  ORF type:complete len:500 (-),score=131.14 Transcript_6101:128-1627(-)